MNALYRAHKIVDGKASRLIRQFIKYRYAPIWSEGFLYDAIRIGNARKPPLFNSCEETIEIGSSLYASGIFQYVKGKRHY